MPVTIKVASHGTNEWNTKLDPYSSSHELLETTLEREASEAGKIFQTSVSDAFLNGTPFRHAKNGLVTTAFCAYTSHQNLVLRPEDIWFAVLSQFSFYVNAHSEELRGSFVAHEGKKGLILQQDFEDSIDFGVMCQNMTKLIEQNIVDPKLRDWVLPSFTTTTEVDSVVASALMMGMLKNYFDYVFDPTCCGIPHVTLLGEQKDYQDILGRIEKLTEYGEEPTHFAKLLRPVLRGMIASFTAPPGDKAIREFWSRIVHHKRGSGFSALSGWITAFCLWDADGKCMSQLIDKKRDSEEEMDKTELGNVMPAVDEKVTYHSVDMQKIPSGWVTVPVTVVQDQTTIQTKILAGSFGVVGRAATEFYHPAVQPATGEAGKDAKQKPPRKEDMLIPDIDSRIRFMRRMGRKAAEEEKDDDDLLEAATTSDGPAQTPAVDPSRIDTLQPLTGWWLYTLKDGNLGMSLAELIKKKKEGGEWKGGSSTGRVYLNGDMVVRRDDTEEEPKGLRGIVKKRVSDLARRFS